MPPKKARKKPVNGYKMPDPLPAGEILTDISKKQWRLGTSIGKGGFGEIYAAQEAAKSSSKYPFVIKVEPHGNGPLFVEMHFYMKNAREPDIEAFKKKHKLKSFGMPKYIGSGSHELGGTKYRFIVMEKFGADIDKLRPDNKGVLPVPTVFQLAWQMIQILEYIHERDYVHADIKGANILLGITAETRNQAYLVDFGLATKFSTDKEFKVNPKKAHDGTIEYLSRDAHQGVPTRRGDLEILGYNMVHWLCGSLPWESALDDPKSVQQMKEDCMSDIPTFLKKCFKNSTVPKALNEFLKYVSALEFNKSPNYEKVRNFFEKEVTTHGSSISAPLDFHSIRKRRSLVERETPEKKTKEEENEEKPKRRVKKEKVSKKKETLVNDNEEIETNKEEVLTNAMKEILAKKSRRSPRKKKPISSVSGESGDTDTGQIFEGYTAEMMEIKLKKINNEKKSKSKKKTENTGEEKKVRSRRNLPTVNYTETS